MNFSSNPMINADFATRAALLSVSEEELALAYRKGFAAWKPGQVPGSTPEQLGVAVVEQFLQIKHETLVEAQQDKLADDDADPVLVDKDDKPKKKDDKEEKKPTSYKKFAKDKKYNNQQPADTASSGRTAGTTNFYGENMLPDNANIRAWAMSEKTQSDYTKRYGEKASERLLEAAKKLEASLNKVEEAFTPPKEPYSKHPVGSREHASAMLDHHDEQMNIHFGKNKEAYEHHKSARRDYLAKESKLPSHWSYHGKKETHDRYLKVMKK